MKLIKKTVPIFVAATLLSGAGVSTATAEISGNVGVSSNYLWRGVTQSDDGAAISGGLDYGHDSGFFAGAWISNVDFDDADGSQTERDIYLGFANDVDGLGYSVMYNRYTYSESKDADFGEVMLDLNYGQFSGGLAYTVDSEVDDDGLAVFVEGDMYYYLSGGMDLEDDWSATLTVGYYDFDNDGNSNDVSYSHYQVDLGKSAGEMGDFAFTLSAAEEESGDDDVKAVVSWSKTF